jgi:NADPH:quinone reductase-like Zn-dependent oxidoreductase
VLDATSRHPQDGATDYRREPGDVVFDPIVDLMFAAKSVTGVFVPLLWPREGGPGPLLREAMVHLGDGAIRPAIARTFAFEDAVDALRFLQGRRNVGRVVLEI